MEIETSQIEQQEITLTANDFEVASEYFPILIEVIKRRGRITYGDLAKEGKRRNPNNETLKGVIALRVGHHLSVIRHFTTQMKLLDISCVVVSADTEECAEPFTDEFDAEECRKLAYKTDWDLPLVEFSRFISISKKNAPFTIAVPKKQKAKPTPKPMSITKDEASVIRWDYYSNVLEKKPVSLRLHTDELDKLIMSGVPVANAFAHVIEKFTL